MPTGEMLALPDSVDGIDQFYDATKVILQRLTGPWIDLLFPSNLHEQITAAWKEIEFDELSAEDLTEVGLNGSQLILKLAGVSAAFKLFKESPSIQGLRTVLDWLLIILGSLASKSPRFEQIKELLETLQNMMHSEIPI